MHHQTETDKIIADVMLHYYSLWQKELIRYVSHF